MELILKQHEARIESILRTAYEEMFDEYPEIDKIDIQVVGNAGTQLQVAKGTDEDEGKYLLLFPFGDEKTTRRLFVQGICMIYFDYMYGESENMNDDNRFLDMVSKFVES